MKDFYKYNLQLFDDPTPDPDPEPVAPTPPEGTIVSSDIAPEISIDHVSRLTASLTKLFEIIGLTKITPMPAGSTIKVYKWSTNLANSPGEGIDIPLTTAERELVKAYDLTLKKYRASVTAEAIQSRGRARAINEKDGELIKAVQKTIKTGLFGTLNAATEVADDGATLQAATANAWAKCAEYYEDWEATPVFFVNPIDVATYLGTANVGIAQEFGFSYLKNFLGLGTAIITSGITSGTVIATAAENLNFAYVPAAGGDLSTSFGLTSDETGYVGITHQIESTNATIVSLIMSGCLLYAEDLSGLFKAEIDAT